MGMFDFILESSKAGIRKPNPKIYQMACDEISIEPKDAIFLDDLGINLKPAKALGMTTIKVLKAEQAISELEGLLKIQLR
jgi:putative hydrolase of the HAD superfamily